jgi:hypothetical protein
VTVAARLGALRDVPGVYGSFLVDRWGGVVSREVSAVIGTSELQRAGACLWRLWYGLDASFADELVLEFSHHRLLARRLRAATLGVLVGSRAALEPVRAACEHLRLGAVDPAFAPVGPRGASSRLGPALTAG